MNREFFIFYSSFYDAISELDDASQLALYKAITEFALFYVEPELTGVANAVWKAIRPNLVANWNKYMNGCKGGCPKGTKKPSMIGNQNARIKTDSKPNQNQNQTKTIAINKEQIIINKEQETKNKENTSIPVYPELCASELAPGCGIDDDVFVHVVQLYNDIMKVHPMDVSDLDESRRNSIAYYYRQMGGDMTRIESVFKIIAKKDKNTAFDDIFNHPSFVPIWLKAKNGTNQTNQKS